MKLRNPDRIPVLAIDNSQKVYNNMSSGYGQRHTDRRLSEGRRARRGLFFSCPSVPQRNPNLKKEKCLWKNKNVSASADAARS